VGRLMAVAGGFRYPFDIQSSLEPWRQKLGRDFDAVVAHLADRDRALEDYLSVGVAQGYLGTGVVPNLGQSLTASYADVAGATVTFTVPGNRQVKVTAYVSIISLAAVNQSSFIRILDESSNVVRGDSVDHGPSGSKDASKQYNTITFLAPAAGTHTYKLQALINGGSGSLTSNVPANNSGGSSFLSVEDIGPVRS